MRIDLLCNDGSPIGVTPPDIYGRGVGGAELAMLSLVTTLAARGHDVRVFNDPQPPGVHEGVEFLPLTAYDNRVQRDALIIFRSPNARVRFEDRTWTRLIWWSTDQFTVGSFKELGQKVDLCVTISPHHAQYLSQRYAIPPSKLVTLDLGVRQQDYENVPEPIPHRLIYCSVPDRGLPVLHACWPLIRREVPDATLVITSDYRLWGLTTPNNHQHRLAWAGEKGVEFLGRIPRLSLCQEQMKAQINAYPCTYDELFCISVAECQVAGAMPVTSAYGALPTTNQYGIQVFGTPTEPGFVRTFVQRIVALMTEEQSYFTRKRDNMIVASRRRFDWNRIAADWERLIEKGRLEESA
jgi:glycosyltransferase involved in cell wall biosynthesis